MSRNLDSAVVMADPRDVNVFLERRDDISARMGAEARMAGKLILNNVVAFVLLAAPAATAMPSKDVISLRMLTESEYRHSIADIFGPNIEVQGRFEPGHRIGGLSWAKP